MKTKISVAERILLYLNDAFLCAFTFICLYPFYSILINSLSVNSKRTNAFLPNGFTLKAYDTIFKTAGIFASVSVSVARMVSGTLICVICSSFVAYLFTQQEMPFRKTLYRLFVFTMYISAGFIPYYLLISNLGMKNTFWVYIIPGAVSAYYIILVKTYIESIPRVLQESAEIDGAGVLTVYIFIILPLCLPILACLIVFCAVNHWNSWADNLYFVTDKNLTTLQFKLYQLLQSNMGEAMRANPTAAASGAAAQKLTPTTLRMAMTFFTALPILCVYPFMQKYFIRGIMLGAVKG